jgi:predicted DNA-binding transcriptional regulator AlpA
MPEADATQAPPLKPITVTVKQALHLSGLGCSTIYKLMANGTLLRRKIGSRTLISYESLERLLTPKSEGAL